MFSLFFKELFSHLPLQFSLQGLFNYFFTACELNEASTFDYPHGVTIRNGCEWGNSFNDFAKFLPFVCVFVVVKGDSEKDKYSLCLKLRTQKWVYTIAVFRKTDQTASEGIKLNKYNAPIPISPFRTKIISRVANIKPKSVTTVFFFSLLLRSTSSLFLFLLL